MSDLGNNLPPRNASGRFIKRTAVPIPQPPADNLEPDPVPIPAPTPRTVTQPSADDLEPNPAPASPPTLRPIAQPSELEPRTPSPHPPAPLTTPAHSATPNAADNEAPLPAPDFGNLDSLSPDSSIHTGTDSESPPPAAVSWEPPTLGQQSTNLAAPLRPLLPSGTLSTHLYPPQNLALGTLRTHPWQHQLRRYVSQKSTTDRKSTV